MPIVYLCNGKEGDCIPLNNCRLRSFDGECSRTFDERYAKNGPCKDPQNHPERFIFDEEHGWYIEKE